MIAGLVSFDGAAEVVGGTIVAATAMSETGADEEAIAAAQEAEGLLSSALPQLTGSILDSFEGGQYSEVMFHAGDVFYRAEALGATSPGSFLGLESVDSAAEAEQAYNLQIWGNPMEILRTYVLTKDTTMYYGNVAGGEGYQALVPRGVDPSSILQFVSAKLLQ